MKHIKKRFLIQTTNDKFDIDNQGLEVIDINDKFNNKILAPNNGAMVYIKTLDDAIIGGFIHKVDGKSLMFPVPDPTLIYFNDAQSNIARIKEFRSNLMQKLDFEESAAEPALNEMYNFYGATTGFIVFLFTAIESFINSIIPNEFVYVVDGKNKTELYNKSQIQDYIDFKTKLTKVLRASTGQDFFVKQTPANQLLFNLKEFRDDIIHTKADQNPLKYDRLIKISLSFRYTETLAAAAKFMNFYKPGYIIECECGMDF